MGHALVDYDDYDVQLAFIEATKQPKANKPLVQRLDGIWFKPDEFLTRNVYIKSTWDHANAIVWQSEFDRNMTEHHWGPQNGVVINNGIDLTKKVTEHHSAEIETLRKEYDHFFVCSSNWHPQKRVYDNFHLYQYIKKHMPGKSCLVVMGHNPPGMLHDNDTFCTGTQPEEIYLEMYSAADWMIHLAWLDHCPNVVVEALSQETPVICTSSGGTKELVQEFGIVLHENTSYNYELIDYDNPPIIDVTQIDITKLLTKPPKKHADIDIVSCAKRYINLFETLLKEMHE
jgi:glycosyltransferase involved in cell wall biosynthesis